MIARLPLAHRLVGGITLALFLATGAFMRSRFPAVYAANESIRYLYRASHIYLLFAGLVNLALGSYLSIEPPGGRRAFQVAGSLALLAAVAVLAWAFLVEPPLASPHRPRTLLGVVLALAGTVLHAIAGRAPAPAPRD